VGRMLAIAVTLKKLKKKKHCPIIFTRQLISSLWVSLLKRGEISHLFLKSKREIMPTCKCKLPHILKEQVSEVRTIGLVMHIYMFRLPPALLWVKWDMPRMQARSGPHLLPCPKSFGMLPTLGFYPTHKKNSNKRINLFYVRKLAFYN
jgi:hypothetical protein